MELNGVNKKKFYDSVGIVKIAMYTDTITMIHDMIFKTINNKIN